jgi:hypothetical protein
MEGHKAPLIPITGAVAGMMPHLFFLADHGLPTASTGLATFLLGGAVNAIQSKDAVRGAAVGFSVAALAYATTWLVLGLAGYEKGLEIPVLVRDRLLGFGIAYAVGFGTTFAFDRTRWQG